MPKSPRGRLGPRGPQAQGPMSSRERGRRAQATTQRPEACHRQQTLRMAGGRRELGRSSPASGGARPCAPTPGCRLRHCGPAPRSLTPPAGRLLRDGTSPEGPSTPSSALPSSPAAALGLGLPVPSPRPLVAARADLLSPRACRALAPQGTTALPPPSEPLTVTALPPPTASADARAPRPPPLRPSCRRLGRPSSSRPDQALTRPVGPNAAPAEASAVVSAR